MTGITFINSYEKNIINQYEKHAAKDYRLGVVDTVVCPVCGINNLRKYEESDEGYDEEGDIISRYTFIPNVNCINCVFDLLNNIKNPKEYGYDIPDFFELI